MCFRVGDRLEIDMDFEWDHGLWAPQLRSVESVVAAWEEANRLLLFSPTGSGKTRMCGEIFRWANHHGKRAIFYANRKLLIGQTDERFSDLGLDVGIRAADYDHRFDDKCPVQIASADTERARVFKGGRWDFFDVGEGGIVAVDECLDGDSLIETDLGAVKIKDAAKCKKVLSCDGESVCWRDIIGWKHTCRKQTLKITLDSGRQITCTANHLLMTRNGWKKAGELTVGASLKCFAGADVVNMLGSETNRGHYNTASSAGERAKARGTTCQQGGRLLYETDRNAGVDAESYVRQGVAQSLRVSCERKDIMVDTGSLPQDTSIAFLGIHKRLRQMKSKQFWERYLEIPALQFRMVEQKTLGSVLITARNRATGQTTRQGCFGGSSLMSVRRKTKGMATGLSWYLHAATSFLQSLESIAIQVARRLSQETGLTRLAKLEWLGGLQMTGRHVIRGLAYRLIRFPNKSTKSLWSGLKKSTGQHVSRNQKKAHQFAFTRMLESKCSHSHSTFLNQCTTNFERVASIEPGGVRDVYDIEVEGTHCFFANGMLVHNCHLQKTKVMKDILQWYEKRGAKILLLTATPVAMGGWADRLLVGGRLSEWRSCGALVPVYTYNISQPDMRKVKRNNVGEFVMDDGKKMEYLQTIVGEVIENWELLNDGSPTMCYAPGVPESIWLAEKFRARGHEFVHVDATDAYIGGKRVKMTQQVWHDILSGVKSGDIRGLSSRFKLREGVDIPTAGHCVLATPVGSLASYLQILGRVMRSAPGKTQAILQDHGAAYHLHGSPNLDRPWEALWQVSESAASTYHQDLIREGQIKEPIRCPACGMERTSGSKCPGCGHEASKGKRAIRMETGELSEIVEGPMIKPRRRVMKATTAEDWAKMFWGFKRKKVDRSFAQMEAYFCREHGYLPPRDLPYMPKHFLDWKAKVHQVEFSDLIHSKDTTAKGVDRRLGGSK